VQIPQPVPESVDLKPLSAVLATLVDLGTVPATGPALAADAATVQQELAAEILERVPAFRVTANPDILPELAAHSGEHVAEIVRLLGGGTPGDLAFVSQHAQRRAEQRFPLEATLHAYRCGHKVIYNWIRRHAVAAEGVGESELGSAIADFSIEYTDLISTVVAADYVAHTRALAEAEGDRRSELFGVLLGGFDESDGRVARLLRRAGYLEQRQSYCVALARSVDAREMEKPTRARRMADAVGNVLSRLPGRQLVGVRDDRVVAIISDTRRLSGWTAPQTRLADRVYPELLRIGPAALIGMSTDVPSTSHIPKALAEAEVALDFATVSERVVRYSSIPVRQMVLRQARDALQASLPAWVDELLAADNAAGGTLVATLRAYADADMNVLRAAKALAVHANTVYGRLQKIVDLTGLDARGYGALTELLLATDCRQA